MHFCDVLPRTLILIPSRVWKAANVAVNGFVGGPGKCVTSVNKPFLLAYAADDPVEPQGPDQFWFDSFSKGIFWPPSLHPCRL